jgi:hypothetical protein
MNPAGLAGSPEGRRHEGLEPAGQKAGSRTGRLLLRGVLKPTARASLTRVLGRGYHEIVMGDNPGLKGGGFMTREKRIILTGLFGIAVLLTPPAAESEASPASILRDRNLRQITADPAPDIHVRWSPNGKMLAFASWRSGELKIWLIPSEGGDAKMLETGLSGDHHISRAPDGTRIAFMSKRSGKQDIWIVPVSGGALVRFTDESDNAWPTWSPDGKKIAFASKRAGGHMDVWVKDVK